MVNGEWGRPPASPYMWRLVMAIFVFVMGMFVGFFLAVFVLSPVVLSSQMSQDEERE